MEVCGEGDIPHIYPYIIMHVHLCHSQPASLQLKIGLRSPLLASPLQWTSDQCLPPKNWLAGWTGWAGWISSIPRFHILEVDSTLASPQGIASSRILQSTEYGVPILHFYQLIRYLSPACKASTAPKHLPLHCQPNTTPSFFPPLYLSSPSRPSCT
jgi:hypothetical protein